MGSAIPITFILNKAMKAPKCILLFWFACERVYSDLQMCTIIIFFSTYVFPIILTNLYVMIIGLNRLDETIPANGHNIEND